MKTGELGPPSTDIKISVTGADELEKHIAQLETDGATNTAAAIRYQWALLKAATLMLRANGSVNDEAQATILVTTMMDRMNNDRLRRAAKINDKKKTKS